MALGGIASLIIASSDLQVVRLLRDAIRTTELSGAARRATELGPLPSPDKPPHIHPTPVIEPRRHIHPTPVVEPRQHIHHSPRFDFALPDRLSPSPPLEAMASGQCHSKSPIEPPWRVVPWRHLDRPRPVIIKPVKIVIQRPDVSHVGAMIDTFI